MDPNVCLERIRALVRQGVMVTDQGIFMEPNELDELLQAIMDLDGWLVHGGFLPTEWQR